MKLVRSKKLLWDTSDIGFLEFYLPIYSILIYYTLPVVGSIGQMILFFYVLIFLLTHRNILFSVPKEFLLFVLITIPIQIFDFLSVGGFNTSRAVNLVMILVYLFLLSIYRINLSGLYKVYKIVAVLSSIAIIVQFVQIYFMNQIVHTIMLLPMDRPKGWYSEGLRPQGFFPEPQVYATFILPVLVLALKNKDYKLAVFFSVSIVLSTSSLGVLCTAGVWLYYILFSPLGSGRKISLITLVIIGAIALTQMNIFEYTIQKITSTDFSNNVRLTRGFSIYNVLPDVNKFFGIGVNNLKYFHESGQLNMSNYNSFGMRNPAYITTIPQLLINYGLISTLLYLKMLYVFFKNTSLRLMVVLLFVLSFGQTILFSGVWYLYVVIIISANSKDAICFKQMFIRHRSGVSG